MLAAIKSFFSDWFGGGIAENGFSGGRRPGGIHGFDRFGAEHGFDDFWAAGSHAPGATREMLVAETAYEQRLQNTLDANAARQISGNWSPRFSGVPQIS